MIRSVIPLVAIILFFLEPVFSLFSPVSFGEELYTLVPRFVIVHLIFTAIYYSKRFAIICGIVFGLLYDMFYIDIIGLYAFLYPMICLIAVLLIRYVQRNYFTVMILSLLLIALLEMLSYGFASLIGITSIDLNEFFSNRLLPTMLANLIFVVMFGWLFKKLMDSKAMIVLKDAL